MWQQVYVTRHYLPQLLHITPELFAESLKEENLGPYLLFPWASFSQLFIVHCWNCPCVLGLHFKRKDTLTTGFSCILDKSNGGIAEVCVFKHIWHCLFSKGETWGPASLLFFHILAFNYLVSRENQAFIYLPLFYHYHVLPSCFLICFHYTVICCWCLLDIFSVLCISASTLMSYSAFSYSEFLIFFLLSCFYSLIISNCIHYAVMLTIKLNTSSHWSFTLKDFQVLKKATIPARLLIWNICRKRWVVLTAEPKQLELLS